MEFFRKEMTRRFQLDSLITLIFKGPKMGSKEKLWNCSRNLNQFWSKKLVIYMNMTISLCIMAMYVPIILNVSTTIGDLNLFCYIIFFHILIVLIVRIILSRRNQKIW